MSKAPKSRSSSRQHSTAPYRILITGAAGFIGSHTAARLMDLNHEVIGLDNLNEYYSTALKQHRLDALMRRQAFQFVHSDLSHYHALNKIFNEHEPDIVIHLAAQAGVRYSMENPHSYISSNIAGTQHILECCRHHEVLHLLFASSSSVYGLNSKMPYTESDPCDHPVSLYAATKKSNEVMAHSYCQLYNIPITGLRFFTVYGPQGRPDMACWKFLDAILNDREICIYNNGNMLRDFTYIDDAVHAICQLLHVIPQPTQADSKRRLHPCESSAPFAIYNIAKGHPDSLMDMVSSLERHAGRPAKKVYLSMQPGDVVATWGDCKRLRKAIGKLPETELDQGIQQFTEWYLSYSGAGIKQT